MIEKLRHASRTIPALAVLLAALMIGLYAEPFTIVSHAVSEGKVTATSAKIRKAPKTDSEALSGVSQDTKVSIRGKVAADDGYTWYQVFIDADTFGYVRSDLVEITDGSTPPTITPGDEQTVAPAEGNDPPAEGATVIDGVAQVNPTGANVTGGQAVRVRESASTSSRIITTAEDGEALTVVGTATGDDGSEWYQVHFTSNGSEINGFIRSDYVALSEELMPAGIYEEPVEPVDYEEPVYTEPEIEEKEWDTYFEGDSWHLIDNISGDSYEIESIFRIAEDNKAAADDALTTRKAQQIAIIILIILLVLLVIVISSLLFKLRDMNDSAYIQEVERETIRKRTADRPQRGKPQVNKAQLNTPQAGSSKVLHTVGVDKKAGGQRPAGQRSMEDRAGMQDPRMAGAGAPTRRPTATNLSGQAVGNDPNAPARRAVVRPQGAESMGTSRAMGTSRTAGTARTPGATYRSQTAAPQRRMSQEPGWKSRNFLEDNDEFEFNFLNGDDE